MPTVVTNQIRDTVGINQDRRVIDIMDKIHLLEPDKAPLTILLAKLRKSKAINPEYKWLEDELFPKTDRINDSGGESSGSTALTVDNGSYFKANDIITVTATGEVIKVTSVSGNVLTVVRAWGSTTAAADMPDNAEIVRLGNASEEGAARPVIKTLKTTTVTNYTQIFRTPFGATRTETQSDLYGGSDRDYKRKKKLIEHLRDMENAFWFGEDNGDGNSSAGAHPQRTTKGISKFITTNVTTLGGAGLTQATFDTFLKDIFRYGSSTKFVFCSPLAIEKISAFAQSAIRVVPQDKTFGISITRYLSPHGTVNLIRDVQFEGDTYDEWAIALDMENIGMKVMQDTVLRTNIQANDVDGWEDEYLTEAGVILRLEKTHGMLKNVGGSAVA